MACARSQRSPPPCAFLRARSSRLAQTTIFTSSHQHTVKGRCATHRDHTIRTTHQQRRLNFVNVIPPKFHRKVRKGSCWPAPRGVCRRISKFDRNFPETPQCMRIIKAKGKKMKSTSTRKFTSPGSIVSAASKRSFPF